MTHTEPVPTSLKGVFPVLPTPFFENGHPDPDSLARLVGYLIQSGVQGMTYPGVASEVNELTLAERVELTQLVLEKANKVVKQVAEAEKYDLILQEAVYINPKHDITEKVIKAINSGK